MIRVAFVFSRLEKSGPQKRIGFFEIAAMRRVLFTEVVGEIDPLGKCEGGWEWAAMPLPFRVIWQRGCGVWGVLGWGDVDSKITKSCIPFLYTFVEKVSLL